MNTLALDISLSSTGWSVFTPDQVIVDFGAITPTKEALQKNKEYLLEINKNKSTTPRGKIKKVITKESVSKNLLYLYLVRENQLNTIKFLIEKYNIGEVVIEDYSLNSMGHSQAITSLLETAGVIKFFILSIGLNLFLISPKTMKKYITGSGNTKKEETIQVIIDRFPILRDGLPGVPTKSIFDVADSIGIGLTYFGTKK